jgi:NTE family protein
MDGAVVDNTPIGRAVGLGADVVYVLPTEYRSTGLQQPRSALGAALRALTVMTEDRLLSDVERFGEVVRLHVIPPPATLTRSPIDLGGTAELIEAAEETATQWLDMRHRRCGARLVRVHHHDGQTTISVDRSRVRRHGPDRPPADGAHRPPAA